MKELPPPLQFDDPPGYPLVRRCEDKLSLNPSSLSSDDSATPRLSPVGCSSESSTESETLNLVEEVYIHKSSITRGLIEDVERLSLNQESKVQRVVVTNEDNQNGGTDGYDVVVGIDIGTTYSGYAFAYADRLNDKQIHMMRQSEGGDRGLNNQKVPTALLLTPKKDLHSFGFTAREYYHDLDPLEAKEWYYFDRFKMHLHSNMDVNRETWLTAQNGKRLPALEVFSHTLQYIKKHVYSELGDSTKRIRWVITVPALWTQQAKQFVREAAYLAELCSPQESEQLLIALEPEAASICCRNLHYDQILRSNSNPIIRPSGSYMVVDCGGGSVDITVHNISNWRGTLRELHKATGGPFGSVGIDEEFQKLLDVVFGIEFMDRFQVERPAAYNELMLSFESKKRTMTSLRTTTLNIYPPYAFIDFFKQVTGREVPEAVFDYGNKYLTWSNEGILKIHPSLMYEMFKPTLDRIVTHIDAVLRARTDSPISHLFLVGGFSESELVQTTIRDSFSSELNIIIPQAVSLSVLKGAVLFGLDPSIVTSRRVTLTYGIGVVKPFLHGIHPEEKLVIRGGQSWCTDVFEPLVESGQAVSLGEVVSRKYTPASSAQRLVVLKLYATMSKSALFVTDDCVSSCGTLTLKLPDQRETSLREIIVSLVFGGTEVRAFAVDSSSGLTVQTSLDFLGKSKT